MEEALSRGRHASAPVRAKVLNEAGCLATILGNFAVADALLEESVALARGAGQNWDAAYALFLWTMLAVWQKEYARAAARAQECRTLVQEVGDPWLRARSLLALGLAARHQGDAVSARAFLEESLAVAHSLGDRFLIARLTAHLGAVALSQGECEQARALYREALLQCQESADKPAITGCLSGLAAVAARAQAERAARLFGAAEALREAVGFRFTPLDPGGYDRHVATLRAQLDEETYAAAWAEGRAMPLEEAIRHALEEVAC
jgi:tetratricopeptide (TPR) repeat protein